MNNLQPNDLSVAIERLYIVFGAYQGPRSSSFCEHCVRKEDDDALWNKPLRELHENDVYRYWWKAMSTWGTVGDFKHFLPRLLEILPFEDVRNDPETLLGKLNYGRLSEWPEAERQAINAYCTAIWQRALGHHPLNEVMSSFYDIDTCLCSIAQVVDDLSPLLELWDHSIRQSAKLHLIDFANENVADIREYNTLSNTFWGNRRDQMRQVQNWFMSHDFCIAFDVATQVTTNEEICADIARGIRRGSAEPMPDYEAQG